MAIFSMKSAFLKPISTEIGRIFFFNFYFSEINTISTVSERFENGKGLDLRKKPILGLKMTRKWLFWDPQNLNFGN